MEDNLWDQLFMQFYIHYLETLRFPEVKTC